MPPPFHRPRVAGHWPGRLLPRQVDALLKVLVVLVVATGVASLAIGTSWSRGLTAVHGVAGFTLVLLGPAKARGSVRTGLRRRRGTRWLSLVMAALVITTISLGILHSTGLWFGVGYWSALWTHVLVACTLVAFFVWHVVSRPGRPKVADLDRRALLRAGGLVAVAAATYGAQEVAVRVLALAGGARRFTGSHETGSFTPERMPTVSWIDDRTPASTFAGTWPLEVAGARVPIERLWDLAQPVRATLDCTGGWYATQLWDAVPLATLLAAGDGRSARSINVGSATGYSRLFPARDADALYLAVGYRGRPLRAGHGAPVRVVAPGRRGPWWVKWVTSVQLDDRPWWLQAPFPLE